MFIYIIHIKNLQKVFKAPLKDLLNIEIPEWFISPFEVESANLGTFHKEEFIEMIFDLEVKPLIIFKEKGYLLNEQKRL